MNYEPTFPVGFDTKQAEWLFRELHTIREALEREKVSETYRVLHVAPTRTYAGMIVYADGTDWNPGSGAGVYRRSEDNTTWVHLG